MLFFGHIAGSTAETYLQSFREAAGCAVENPTRLERDYAKQIVVNAEIAMAKLRLFTGAAWTAGAAILVAAIEGEKEYFANCLACYGQFPVRWAGEGTVTAVRIYAGFVAGPIDVPDDGPKETLAYHAVHAAESLITALDADALLARLVALAAEADERA